MANEDVKFARGLSSAIPVEKVPGRFLFETDTGVLHLDVDSTNRTPVVDPRVSTLIERLSDEFQGTKLASDKGVNQDLGASFKVINISAGSIEDLPNFYTEGEDPQPTYALMMVSKVRQGLADNVYIQTLYCDTGSIYSRQVLYYSGNYSGDPWIKIGPNPVDTSDFATKEELDDYLPLTGGTLTGPLRVTTLGPTTGSNNLTLSTSGSNVRITNVATPTQSTDAVNKSYVDGAVASAGGGDFLANGSIPMTGDLNVGDNKIINVDTPTDDTDGANKQYVDSALNSKQNTITGAASTITTSNLTSSKVLISNTSGKVAASAVTSTELGYLDGVTSSIQTQLNNKANSTHTHSQYLQLSGGTMTGNITMRSHKITGLATPTVSTDAATKQYVDQAVEDASSTGNYLPLAGGTMQGNITMGAHAIRIGDIEISYNSTQDRLEFATV